MATITYQLIGQKEIASIYIRLSVDRQTTPRTATGLLINKKDWSKEKKLPKQTSSKNKNTASQLRKLKDYILDKYNLASANGVTINKEWLKHNVDVFFSRITENKKSELLTDAIKLIINEAKTRKNAKGGIGLSKSRINSYKGLLNMINEFQGINQYKVKDVNIEFGKKFLDYFVNKQSYSENYILKKIADLKTVCRNASDYGIKTNIQLNKINSIRPKKDLILFLNHKEQETIKNTKFKKEALKNAKKWLLFGCNIGQRVSDLLEITEENFINRNGFEVIELTQKKTNSHVTIPVLETTKEILSEGLPYKISKQKFNNYIKIICKEAGINQLIEGEKIQIIKDEQGNKKRRKVKGKYFKWELMTSHVCRRSFASNLYGTLPTPLIMSITQHKSELMLLNYIGKTSIDYAKQISDFYELQKLKKEKEAKLTVVKKKKA